MFGKYNYVIVPFMSLLLAQSIKFVIESIKYKKIRLGRFFNGSGGMPSSHNSFVFSLTTLVGINEGIDSVLFAICIVFSTLIMYDSMVVRMETGNQAVTINKLVNNLIEGDTKKTYKILKEEIGHKPIEVLAGIILGILMGIFFA